MKILAAVLLMAPAIAWADDVHHERDGRVTVGAAFGGGGMTVDNDVIGCLGCEYEPFAYEVDAHFGSMVSARWAVMFELQLNVQGVDDEMLFVDRLVTTAVMLAGQHWVTGPVWLKGGMGFATTSATKSDGNVRQHEPHGQGWAIMGAAGYELVSAPRYAVELQGRAITGVGEGITAASLGVGLNWY